MGTILDLARATRNRGRTHHFLGHPLSDACDKTCVEPGGTSSPGIWTCGIRLWVDGTTPDRLPPEEVACELRPPLSVHRWRGVEHRLAHVSGEGARGVDYHEVLMPGGRDAAILVTGNGPAGGRLQGLSADDRTLTINRDCRLVIEGDAPLVWDVSPDGAVAMVRTDHLRFRVHHGFAERTFGDPAPVPPRPETVEAGFATATDDWRHALPARVFAPDPRIAQAWERNAWHLLSQMECGQPRIGAVNYPVFWLRDGVLCLRALDFLGRHDLARIGADALAPMVFGGGFGAEADGPGEGLWVLAAHARITGGDAWLAEIFPRLAERVAWIRRMRTATAPLRALSENRIPACLHAPGSSLVCLAAEAGTIHGRMDWHTPDFFINCWAVGGLRAGAWAARRLGRPEAAAWTAEADELERAVAAHLLPRYGNDRDPIISPWPSGALAEQVKESFARWFAAHRTGPEPLWTYFEAAQAHNAFLLGLRSEAWTCLDRLLDVPDQVHGEGRPDGNERLPYRNDLGSDGWLDPMHASHGNMPHCWTSAEMIAALRDVFVTEDGDGVVLGRGVPRTWLAPGACFGVRDLPTDRGPVSYTATVRADRGVDIDFHGACAFRTDFPG